MFRLFPQYLTVNCLIAALGVLSGIHPLPAMADEADCQQSGEATLWISPDSPLPGATVRVMAVTTDSAADTLSMGNGQILATTGRGGPPWSLEAETRAVALPMRIELLRNGQVVACKTINSGNADHSGDQRTSEGWTRPVEAFYAAWIEKLFDGPSRENLGFKSLEPVLRDPQRNFLHNHLGMGEDTKLSATPDCADLPYFLRTYFAWKIGLPVSFRACDRGTASRPPHCGPATIDERFTHGHSPQAAFTGLMRQIADTVHSGSGRTGMDDEATDFYPVPLERDGLWPGTLYADPYGHTLILSKWVPQGSVQPGILLAADAQPDNSVARKRFWEGNFLFANTPSAGPGFKTFRPLIRDGEGRLRLPSNTWLAVNAPVAQYSDQQDGMSPDDFYANVARLINPRGLSPEQAYDTMLDALVEQLQTRVGAIDNGERYMNTHRGSVIPMPSGAAIFETIGPWEDYATPSRDMRALIALKVLAKLPEQIARYPALFALGNRTAAEARATIEERHAQKTHERHFSYTRSDGSSWELSIADVYERQAALETGYNPNDCVESRWGALPDSTEYATCQRHAPAEQKARMNQYRSWFQKTQRPTRQ